MLTKCKFCNTRVRPSLLALHIKHCRKYRSSLKRKVIKPIDLVEVKKTGKFPEVQKVVEYDKLTIPEKILLELSKDEFTAAQITKNLGLDWSRTKLINFLKKEPKVEVIKTSPLKFRTKPKNETNNSK